MELSPELAAVLAAARRVDRCFGPETVQQSSTELEEALIAQRVALAAYDVALSRGD